MKVSSLFLMTLLGFAASEKILLLMPLGSKSHFTVFEHLAKGLGERGHKVTVVSVYPLQKQYNNVQMVQVDFPDSVFAEEVQRHVFVQDDSASIFAKISNLSEHFMLACENMFNNDQVKAIIEEVKMKNNKYDVALVNGFMNECALPLGSIAAKQLMFVFSVPIPHWIAHYFNIPTPFSTVPSIITHSLPPFSYKERFLNTIGGYSFLIFYHYFQIPKIQNLVDKYLPEGTPTILEAMKEVSFILASGDPVFAVSRPSVPFLEDIGGIHLKEPKPLPKEFEDFIKNSGEEGFILFSLGSLIQSKFMPKETINAFIKAFSKLKQKVIWKFEETIQDLPPNIKLTKWMPQQDILGHPKCRLFLTHCGRFSLQEAAYHGVPVIGMPLFGDQHLNIAVVKENGFGEELNIRNITDEEVFSIINKVLKGQRYVAQARKVSYILKDRLTNPLDRAIYWTEYVMRHDGAFHLRNKGSQELNLFQYLLLDVFGVLAIALALVVIILARILAVLLGLCFKKQKGSNKEKIN